MYFNTNLLIIYIIFVTVYIIIRKNNNIILKFQFSGRIITSGIQSEEVSAISPQILNWLLGHRHKHDFREIMAVISGNCYLRLKNKYFHLQEGDIVLLDSMEEHTDGHYPDIDAAYWWGSFWTDMLRVNLWKENKIAYSDIIPMGSFNEFIYHLWDEIAASGIQEVGDDIANIITALVHHNLRINGKEKLKPQFCGRNEIMEKILQYIDSMPSMNCTLDSLALLAGYSKVHFQRCFFQYTGMVFREYLLRKRIERYFRIVGDQNSTLKEMAYKLGFSSSSAFLHWKKRNRKKLHF